MQLGNLAFSAFSTSFIPTVRMSYLPDKCCYKSSILDKSSQFNMPKHSQLFSDKNSKLETTFVANKTYSERFTGMLPRQSSVNPQFRITNFDHRPVKKATVKSIKSPPRRVQAGRVKNDLKSQQAKLSLIPRPSFITSRKSLHGSRCTQITARKELIKKMVFLAQCSLKENEEPKKETPVRVLAGLTPKRTPHTGSYLILPEFKKKTPKVDEIKAPIADLVKKEFFTSSIKTTPVSEKKNKILFIKPSAEGETLEVKKAVPVQSRFSDILLYCKSYEAEVSMIHGKIKLLDNSFERKLKNLPDYRVYNEYCSYQLKKERLYTELQRLEEDFRNLVSANTKIGSKLQSYISKKQEIFEKQLNLHRNFKDVIDSTLENGTRVKDDEKQENKPKVETPQPRRSLRLSKMRKNKIEEISPMTKRLKKLDTRSKGIRRSGKV